jgi:hypothetical protein
MASASGAGRLICGEGGVRGWRARRTTNGRRRGRDGEWRVECWLHPSHGRDQHGSMASANEWGKVAARSVVVLVQAAVPNGCGCCGGCGGSPSTAAAELSAAIGRQPPAPLALAYHPIGSTSRLPSHPFRPVASLVTDASRSGRR